MKKDKKAIEQDKSNLYTGERASIPRASMSCFPLRSYRLEDSAAIGNTAVMTITEWRQEFRGEAERRAIGPDNALVTFNIGAVIMRAFDARRAFSPHSRCLLQTNEPCGGRCPHRVAAIPS